MQYCLPEIPATYLINKFRYRCRSCGSAFDFYIPNGEDGVVRFIESNGSEIRWLPVYGHGGYLELFERFMPGFLASGRPAIPPIIAQFMNQLQNHLEPSEAGHPFELSTDRAQCPQCKKFDVEMLNETMLMSPEVSWLKIDCELLNR